MKNKIFLWFASVSLMPLMAILSCKSPAPPDQAFRLNLSKGKKFTQEITWATQQEIMDRHDEFHVTSDFLLEVLDNSNGLITLQCSYTRFRLNMKIAGMEIDINSNDQLPASNQDNPVADVFRLITGKPFQMTVNEQGDIKDVNGIDQIIHSIVDSIKPDEDMAMQMRVSLQDQFNEQAIKDQFAQVFTIFPNKKIKEGDSWQKVFQTGGKVPAKYSALYTVRNVAEEHVVLDVKADILPAGSEMKVNGSQSGSLRVDRETGIVLNAEFDQRIETAVEGIQLKISGKGTINGKEQ